VIGRSAGCLSTKVASSTQYGASYACAKNTEGCGIVYRLTPSRETYTETILYVFKGGNDGLLPISGLAMDSSSSLYGTTWLGGGVGSTGIGTVYKLTPSGSGYAERVIHAFQGGRNDGATPWAPVLVEPNGDVDGTTLYGGSNDKHCTAEGYGGNCGVVFSAYAFGFRVHRKHSLSLPWGPRRIPAPGTSD
jgi:uncharacterized repeat protein (TIGR03803 family)